MDKQYKRDELELKKNTELKEILKNKQLKIT